MESLNLGAVTSFASVRIKIAIFLVIATIISLAIVIMSGRILDDIRKSGQKDSNPHIKNAYKWAAWTVGISSTLTFLSIVALIVLIALTV